MSKKKINPNRRPATQADVQRAKNETVNKATKLAMVIFLTVMADKEGYGTLRLNRVWKACQELSQSISKGYVNLHDLTDVLKNEYNCDILKD